ncbi:RHS repeat-associated core domain-containing protein [Pyxidicoccus xibeiensis]|uniref:RHS repeat-associated core domain-containing protein n=1 Tax=Pyxidicoccus xibeiensis TaxID=2906759 RepID=UPI0020A7D1B8|nr:RHS repeat-associated core domain-containing protein [Pyxidicoccus xibeiensis]MCP3142492.1 FG-GAP-like repeat-containing protein [Pyxidicoccus xibeiensis]
MKKRFMLGLVTLATAGACGSHQEEERSHAAAPRSVSQAVLNLPPNTLVPTEVDTAGVVPGQFSGSASVTADGTASYSLPLWVPAGRAGMQPELALAYQGSGDGLLGSGWNLAGLSRVTRCNKTVAQDGLAEKITFTIADVFCLDGQRLIAAQGTYGGAGTTYRTESDTFARVVSVQADALGPTQFKVYLKDGRILTYGQLNGSTLAGERIRVRPSDTSGFDVQRDGQQNRLAWALAQVEDRSGNSLAFHYSVVFDAADSTYEQLPVQVAYTASSLGATQPATRFIDFAYESRPDPRVSYLSGFKMKLSKRMTGVQMRVVNPASGLRELQRSYLLGYTTDDFGARSLLYQVRECDGVGACTKPVTFGYSTASGAFTDVDTGFTDFTDMGPRFLEPYWWLLQPADLNGDGRDDLAYRKVYDISGNTFHWAVRHATESGFGPSSSLQLTYQDCGTTLNHDGRWADINLDGRMDVAMVQTVECDDEYPVHYEHDFFVVTRSASGTWVPNLTGLTDTQASPRKSSFADLDGDGFPELLRRTGSNTSPHLQYRPNVGGQIATQPVDVAPSTASESEAYTLDLDGSGRASILTKERQPGSTQPLGTRYHAAKLVSPGLFDIQETTLVRTDVNNKPYVFLDINGDGLPDAVRSAQSGGDIEILMNTGDGFAPPVVQDLATPYELGNWWEVDNGLRPIDYNQDGRQDLLLMDSRGGARTNLVVLVSNGSRFLEYVLPIPVGRSVPGGYRVSQVLDANGDGLTDLAQVVNGSLHVYTRQGAPTALLTSAQDSLGARAEFIYKPMTDASVYTRGTACAAPQYCLKGGIWLVSELRTDVGLPAVRTQSYHYEDGRTDVQGRGWLGFGKVTVTDAAAGQSVTTEYDHQTRSGSFYPYARQATRETTTTQLGARFHQRVRTFQYRHVVRSGGQSLAVFPVYSVDFEYEGVNNGPATLLRSTSTTWGYDDTYGNLTSRQLTRNTGETTTWSGRYFNFEADWLIGLLYSTTESSQTSGETVVRSRSLEYHPGTALLRKETQSPGAPNLEVSTLYVRAADGLVTQVVQSAPGQTSRSTTLEYDTHDRTFLVALTNALNQRESMVYHWGLGVLAATEDANGVYTAWQYDRFGRPRKEEGPDLADTTYSYSWGLGGQSALRVLSTRAGGEEAFTTYDRLGRFLSVRTRSFHGDQVTTSTEYDVLGRVVKQWTPSPLDATQRVATEFTYDNLGRKRTTRYPDGQLLSNTYEGLKTTSVDARGNLRVVHQHSNGQPASVEEWKDGAAFVTQYGYGPFDLPVLVTDAQGHSTFMGYDRSGRRTRLQDPDTGVNLTRYNPFGEVIEQVDGKGDATTYQRDLLGRETSITHAIDGEVRFTWDTAPHGIGQLASSQRVADPGTTLDDIIVGHTYDPVGRVASDVWTVDGQLYAVDMTYDVYGRLRDQSYPAAGGRRLTVRREYNTWGDLLSVREPASGYAYWTAESRNAAGQLTREQLGNGVVSKRAYDASGRLRFIDSKRATSPVQALAYAYDANGNLSERHDLLGRTTEDFAYDSLNRLTRWSVFQNCLPSVLAYRYDSIGNLLGSDVLQGTGFSSALYYEKTNGAGPHAVTRAGLAPYGYDRNGNQVSGPGRVVEYTGFNLPSRVSTNTGSTLFRYDAAGVRTVKQVVGGERTVYVGGLYEERTAPDGSALHVFSVQGAERVVAQVSWTTDVSQQAGPEQRLFLHADHLGSVETVTDAAGAVVERRKHEPFGGSRQVNDLTQPESPWGSQVRRGFTGHEQDDESGLINMNGRMYDPKLGRFLSADPIVSSAFSGQAYNRYSYVLNNPLSFTDPSGYLPISEAVIVYDSWYGGYAPVPGQGSAVIRTKPSTQDGCMAGVCWSNTKFAAATTDSTVSASSSSGMLKPPTLKGCTVDETICWVATPDLVTVESESSVRSEMSPEFSHFVHRSSRGAGGARGGYGGGGIQRFGSYNDGLARVLDAWAPGWMEWDVRTAGNFASGMGDFLTFNATRAIRGLNDSNAVVDRQSGAYTAGQVSGFVNSLFLGGGAALRPATKAMQQVTHWDTAAKVAGGTLRPGAWVMTGGGTLRNWLFSGTVRMYKLGDRVTHSVPGSALRWPSGGQWFKGLIGQRIYMP